METLVFNNKGIESYGSSSSAMSNGEAILAVSEIKGVHKGIISELLEIKLTNGGMILSYHDESGRNKDYLALRQLLNPTNILAAVNREELNKAFDAAEKTRGTTLKLQRTVAKETESVR